MELLDECERFTKNRVEQLAIDADTGLLIVLTNGQVQLYHWSDLSLVQTLTTSKGASTFALSQSIKSADVQAGFRLAVVVKRRLIVWKWTKTGLEMSDKDISLPTSIKAIAWADKQHLAVALQHGCAIINFDTGTRSELADQPGQGDGSILAVPGISYLGLTSATPFVVSIGQGKVLLSRDANARIVNALGTEIRHFAWSTTPQSIAFSCPFLLSLHSGGTLEVRNAQSFTVYQSLNLPAALHVVCTDRIWTYNDRGIWLLHAESLDSQIATLVEAAEFDEATSLLELGADEEKIRQVKLAKAGHDFQRQHYRVAMDIFDDYNAPPKHVIDLVSGIHVDEDRRNATQELRSFLISVRRKLKRVVAADGSVKMDALSSLSEKDLAAFAQDRLSFAVDRDAEALPHIAELVDTTLFEAYMLISPSLAGPLLRIENFCNAQTVKTKLIAASRYSELVDFLHSKGLHRQALEILQKFGDREAEDETAPQLHGVNRVIIYLQTLGPEYLSLILEFALWPLRRDPERGMQIFLADSENAETLPRADVVGFLERVNSELAMQYLEHIIEEWNDLTAAFHEDLIGKYLDRDVDKATAFLQQSTVYDPFKILPLLGKKEPLLFEARTIVLNRMGQHKEALEIFVYQLQDADRAELYCNQVYGLQQDQDIYHELLTLYLSPKPPHPVQWPPALSLLAKHGARVTPDAVMSLIPTSMPLHDLKNYFRGQLRDLIVTKRMSGVHTAILGDATARLEENICLGSVSASQKGRNRRVLVSEERVCGVCYKRFGGSAIKVMPK